MNTPTKWLLAVPALLLVGGAAGLWAEHQFHPVSKLLAAAGIKAAASDEAEHDAGGAEAENAHADAGTGEEEPAEIEPEPIVRVSIAATGDITQSREAFGTVVPKPGALVAAALNCELNIRKVNVIAGQLVAKDDVLCEVEPSAATLAELAAARDEAESAGKLLQVVRERQAANLGTRQELVEAESAERQAKMRIVQLEASLPDNSGVVKASVSGRVMDVHVQPGAIAAAGTTLVETLADDAVVVELAVLPDDAARLTVGQTIPLEALGRSDGAASIDGVIKWTSGSVDSATQLVDVYLEAPADAALRVGQIMRGRLEMKSSGHVLVQRAAVLPGDDGEIVYVVEDGHAKRHVVSVGLRNSDVVEITNDAVKPGDAVITLGNYELEDGMAVAVEKPK